MSMNSDYDFEFEQRLYFAIAEVIEQVSRVGDGSKVLLRSPETVGALVASMGATLSMAIRHQHFEKTPGVIRNIVAALEQQLMKDLFGDPP
jgi:hypothetical protein